MSNDSVLMIDDRGRIVLPTGYRNKHGKRYRYFRVGERLEIVPVSANPVKALKDEFSKIPSDLSVRDLKVRARKKARDEALEHVR